MRFKTVLLEATLVAFVATLATGCNQGTTVPITPVEPVKAPESTPLPKEVNKGGGPASSGNMQKNPGGNS